jgi:phage terminase large subunit-like protein
MEREYAEYKLDSFGNSAFITKRMNRPIGNAECGVTEWENIAATAKDIPDLSKYSCIGGLDYAQTTDFVAAGLMFEDKGIWYWITHSWVCRSSKDWSRIKFPIEEAEARGLLTVVDAVEIPPELPAEWLAQMGKKYNIVKLAYDAYRHTWIEKALRNVGFDADKDGSKNITLIRPSDIMKTAPMISSQFANQRVVWGDDALMRWYTNNAKQVMDTRGNITYGKIEPKSRKTDGFMAFVAAATQINSIQGWNDAEESELMDIYTY